MPYIGSSPAVTALTSANIADAAVNSDQIATGAVDLAHMSTQSVDEDNLHISNAGSNGQFLSKQSGDAGGLTWAAAGGGKIGQVLHAVKTDRTSITSTTTNAYAAITGLTQAITPVATSSKVLVTAYVSWNLDSGNGTMHFGIFRDSTQIGMGVDSGGTSRNPSTVSFRGVGATTSTGGSSWYTYGMISQAFHFLDSPSTTSSTTYSIKVSGGATYTSTVIINGTDTVTGNSGWLDYNPVASSGITCWEVLA